MLKTFSITMFRARLCSSHALDRPGVLFMSGDIRC